MSISAHILVVDDEPEIAEVLRRYLAMQGYTVSTAEGGAAMRRIMAEAEIDLVLLDLGLPGEDGLALMRSLRETSTVAVIVVTGRGEQVDRIVGLEVGADDYVTKPFDVRELAARVRSVLRRISPPQAHSTDGNAMEFAGFRFDAQMRSLQGQDGDPIQLTTGEYELLVAFLSAPGRVLSRDQLVSELHGHEAGPFDRSIDVQVGRLRRKIERDAANPELIKSVRGAGYVFTPRVQRI